MNRRVVASRVLHAVIHQGNNLDTALQKYQQHIAPNDSAWIAALCYGVLRQWPRSDVLLQQLLHQPLKKNSELLRCLLLCGIHELTQMNTADYACVSQTVDAGAELGFAWAKGLINAVLRNLQRQQPELEQSLQTNNAARHAHPGWLLKQLQQDWPDHWQAIVDANNQQAPMVLRVNTRKSNRDQYLLKLQHAGIHASACAYAENAIVLTSACDVHDLPGFLQGEVSVQDAAAQLVAPLVNPQPRERILDACAAPGGKTGHLLEYQPQLADVVALEIDAQRLQKVQENLHRLELHAQLVQGDAANPATWWDGQPFDRILLDAPCSATGVIRRHPDIKVLRRAEDIPTLAQQQQQMLFALWPLLKPGGMLLYTTCSILRQENDHPLHTWLGQQTDALMDPIEVPWGHATQYGRQRLPGEDDMDGFYYARIRKTA